MKYFDWEFIYIKNRYLNDNLTLKSFYFRPYFNLLNYSKLHRDLLRSKTELYKESTSKLHTELNFTELNIRIKSKSKTLNTPFWTASLYQKTNTFESI